MITIIASLIVLGIIFCIIGVIVAIVKLIQGDWKLGRFFLWAWLVRWFHFRDFMEKENTPRFTYDQITTFYNTAPQKWKMWWYKDKWLDSKKYCLRLRYRKTDKEKDYYSDNEYMYVGVKTLWDYLRVIHFFNRASKRKAKREDDIDKSKKMAEILCCLKTDAVNAQAEAERMMNNQEQELNEILHRLMESATMGGH